MVKYSGFIFISLSIMVVFFSCGKYTIPVRIAGYLTGKDTLARNSDISRDIEIIGSSDGFDSDPNKATICFSPTKMEVEIEWISLSEGYRLIENSHEPEGTGRKILCEINETVDLAAADSSIAIFDKELVINTDLAGTYTFLTLKINNRITVSGSISVDGKVYNITDEELGVGWGETGIALPTDTEVVISEQGKQTVGFVIDVEGRLMFRKIIDEYDPLDPYTASSTRIIEDLGDDDYVIMLIDRPVILPLVTDTSPNVKIYKLTFDATEFGYTSAGVDVWLKVLCACNDSDELMAAGWMPIYGANISPATIDFEPAMLYLQNISDNGDGTYTIEDATTSTVVADRTIRFPAFSLDGEAGGFYYGNEDTVLTDYAVLILQE